MSASLMGHRMVNLHSPFLLPTLTIFFNFFMLNLCMLFHFRQSTTGDTSDMFAHWRQICPFVSDNRGFGSAGY